MLRHFFLLLLCGAIAFPALAEDEDEKPDPKPNQPRVRVVPFNAATFAASRNPVYVLRVPKVAEELKLTDEQKESVDKSFRELIDRQQELRAALRGLQANERQKKIEEYRKKTVELTAKTSKAVRKLLDKDQNARLSQIELQMRGIRALMDPKVVKKLEITKEQTQAMTKLQEDMTKKRQDLFQDIRNGNVQRNQYRAKLDEITKEHESATIEVLNKEQQAAFEKMKGEKFELPARGVIRAVPLRAAPVQPRNIQRRVVPVK